MCLISKPMFPCMTTSTSPSCYIAKMYIIIDVGIYGVLPICQAQLYTFNMYWWIILLNLHIIDTHTYRMCNVYIHICCYTFSIHTNIQYICLYARTVYNIYTYACIHMYAYTHTSRYHNKYCIRYVLMYVCTKYTIWGHYHVHYTDEETEAQRG